MLQRIGFMGLGVLVGVLYWPVEAAVHAFIFNDASFFDSLFVSDPHEIWMRMLISLAFVGFGWVAQRGINEQHILQTRLRRKRDRLHQILDSAYDAYIGMDDSGKIIDWNRSAEAMFGWRANEAIGRQLVDTIMPEHYREAHLKGMKRYLQMGIGSWLYKPVQTQAIHRDGNEIDVEVVVTPIKAGDAQEFFAFIRRRGEK